MVETITPAVHGGRNRRYLATAALHVVGASATAAALGALLGAMGAALGAPWGTPGVVAIAAAATLYLAREALRAPVPLPDLKRQVPQWWRSFFPPQVAAFLYGAGLGIGFATFLSHGTFVAVAAGALVTGDPLLGAAIVAPFGVARAAAVIAAGHLDEGRLESVGSSSLPRALNAAVLILVVAATLGNIA